jgi:hypothetical protein
MLQLAVYNCCPFTHTSIQVDAGIQDNLPSITTLSLRTSRSQRGYGSEICPVLLAAPFLGGIRNYTYQPPQRTL